MGTSVSLFSHAADLLLIVLLVAALIQVYRLARRLDEIRRGRADFERLLKEFGAATASAQSGLDRMRVGSETAMRDLGQRIERAQALTGALQRSNDDLKMLIARAESAADRLESSLGAARSMPADSDRKEKSAGWREGPREDLLSTLESNQLDPEAEALFSALGRIR
jgi:Domain of unknown function (DUF6468)